MAEIVLRVRLTGGDHLDVKYEKPDAAAADEVLEHAISALAEDTGTLRCRHGDRLLVLYGRELSPSRWLRAAPSYDGQVPGRRILTYSPRHPSARNAAMRGRVQAMNTVIAMYWQVAAAQT